MAYSFVPMGSSGQDYDDIAKSLHNKLFFAGEVNHLVIVASLSPGCSQGNLMKSIPAAYIAL